MKDARGKRAKRMLIVLALAIFIVFELTDHPRNPSNTLFDAAAAALGAGGLYIFTRLAERNSVRLRWWVQATLLISFCACITGLNYALRGRRVFLLATVIVMSAYAFGEQRLGRKHWAIQRNVTPQ